MTDSEWKPRQHDHLVEPMLGGIRDAHDEGEDHRELLDPFGKARRSPGKLQQGMFPGWWIWAPFLAVGAGLVWFVA